MNKILPSFSWMVNVLKLFNFYQHYCLDPIWLESYLKRTKRRYRFQTRHGYIRPICLIEIPVLSPVTC